MRSGEIEGPGGRFHFVLSGRVHAPSLVLLHPLGADLSVWDAALAELERFFAVLRIDLRGHGGSQPPKLALATAPLTVADLAADVLAVCDALGVLRAHFCGISLGGAVALEIALTRPERVQRLVLANTTPRFADVPGWQERIDKVRAEGLAPIIAAMPARWFSDEFRSVHAERVEALAVRMRATDTQAYIAACQALQIFDRHDALPGLRVPTLAVAGSRDGVTTAEQIEAWCAEIPGADLLVLDGGHLAVIEQAEDFAAGVIDFLRE